MLVQKVHQMSQISYKTAHMAPPVNLNSSSRPSSLAFDNISFSGKKAAKKNAARALLAALMATLAVSMAGCTDPKVSPPAPSSRTYTVEEKGEKGIEKDFSSDADNNGTVKTPSSDDADDSSFPYTVVPSEDDSSDGVDNSSFPYTVVPSEDDGIVDLDSYPVPKSNSWEGEKNTNDPYNNPKAKSDNGIVDLENYPLPPKGWKEGARGSASDIDYNK